MSGDDDLLSLGLTFALLSLLAIGGVITILPEMHRAIIDVNGWMSRETFATYFALAQAAPGPNVMVVTLIGWHVAGVPGAVVATIGMLGPATALTYAASRLWARWNQLPWYRTFERGVAPVTVGLILAGGWILTASAAAGPVSYAVTAATAALVLFTRVNPLIALASAAALGLAGVV